MSDPLSLLPFAVAAGGGSINGMPAEQLVAAGVTLLQRSPALVRALSGRRSAILLPSGPNYLIALAASEGRGAVLVNPLAAPPEIAYQLRDAGVGAVLTLAAFADRLPAGVLQVHLDEAPRTARVVHDGTTTAVDLGSHVPYRLEGEQGVPGRDEEAVIVYTSAMAGRPLGAILTHRNVLSNAQATVQAARLRADDLALSLLPWSHLFGLVVTGGGPLLAGAGIIAPERFNPLRSIDLLEREPVTLMVGVPAIFGALVQAIERRGAPLRAGSLRLCICGGAPLPGELQERWTNATGVELRQGYGLTEGAPVCLFNGVSRPNQRGSLGFPFPGVEVAIRDLATGAACADGATGEICVRGPNVSPGYVSGGELGLERRNGWLRTGDLGLRTDAGTVTFRGVHKAMFTRNGFNIYPREIELAVRELPGVRAVRVIAVPAPDREHEIALEVTGDVTADDVKRWCQARLSAYKQPGEVTVTPA